MRGNFVRTLNAKKTGRRLFIHQAIKIRKSEHVLLLPLKGLYYEITMILPEYCVWATVFSHVGLFLDDPKSSEHFRR